MRFAKSLFEDSREQHRFPYRFDGTFGWLSEQPSHRHNIATGAKRTLSRQWANILKESGRNEIRIPKAFADFITTSHLHPKVRSISDCYLGLARTFIPFGRGHLLRFLNDSQGCAFWYLYIDGKTNEHCVVICYEYFDADDDNSEDLSTIGPNHFAGSVHGACGVVFRVAHRKSSRFFESRESPKYWGFACHGLARIGIVELGRIRT